MVLMSCCMRTVSEATTYVCLTYVALRVKSSLVCCVVGYTGIMDYLVSCIANNTSGCSTGFMVPSLQGQPSDTNDFLFRFPSNKDPLDMLLLSEQSLDQLTGGF